MLLKYEEKIKLLAGSFTCMDYLAPHGVLDVFQEIAGEHAELLDMGYDALLEKDVLWILVANKYVVVKNPPLYTMATVETWPKEKQRFDFYREYRMKNEKGEDLVYGISRWIIADLKTRKIIIPRDIDYQGEYYNVSNFPGKMEKIKDFDITGLTPFYVTVRITDIDHNMHVNNARYPFFILDAINEASIEEFEITYIKEVKLNEVISIYFIKEDKTYYVKGIINGNETCFLSKLKIV